MAVSAFGFSSGLPFGPAAEGAACSSSRRGVSSDSVTVHPTVSFRRSNICLSRGFSAANSSVQLECVRASSHIHDNGESSSSTEPGAPTTAVESEPPTIELEFIAPRAGADGNTAGDKASVTSGEKLLRTVMNEQKLELYGLYGKIMNCGGGGNCGTCIVEILEGSDLLNERTDAEERYLKKKPSTWRLACQTILGDKSNSGKVVVQRLPQQKK